MWWCVEGNSTWFSSFIDEANVENAYAAVCRSHRHFPSNADVWDVRFHWDTAKAQLIHALTENTYRLKPMQVIRKADQTSVVVWSTLDAIVIKMLTLALSQVLPLHHQCAHIKGHGGAIGSARNVERALKKDTFQFICATDIKGYYANIDKTRLLKQLDSVIDDKRLMSLLTQYVMYTIEDGGEFYTPKKGIPRGSAISPLIGAIYLTLMDVTFAQKVQIFYSPYMDDILILASTRWHLRNMVKLMNKFFSMMGLKQHPDKTFIGKVSKGFDWLGFRFTTGGAIGKASRSTSQVKDWAKRLYEQAGRKPCAERGNSPIFAALFHTVFITITIAMPEIANATVYTYNTTITRGYTNYNIQVKNDIFMGNASRSYNGEYLYSFWSHSTNAPTRSGNTIYIYNRTEVDLCSSRQLTIKYRPNVSMQIGDTSVTLVAKGFHYAHTSWVSKGSNGPTQTIGPNWCGDDAFTTDYLFDLEKLPINGPSGTWTQRFSSGAFTYLTAQTPANNAFTITVTATRTYPTVYLTGDTSIDLGDVIVGSSTPVIRDFNADITNTSVESLLRVTHDFSNVDAADGSFALIDTSGNALSGDMTIATLRSARIKWTPNSSTGAGVRSAHLNLYLKYI